MEARRAVKKAISLIFSSFLVLILSGFVSLRPITDAPQKALAHHTDDSPCATVTLSDPKTPFSDSTPSNKLIVVNGVKRDPGRFYLPSQAHPEWAVGINHDYAGCLDSINQTVEPDYPNTKTFKGTIVNISADVGNVTMYCSFGKNLGTDCGNNISYDTVAFPQNGLVRGFVWSDTIAKKYGGNGWISMGCDNGKNLYTPCGDINYGVKIARFGAELETGWCQDPNNPDNPDKLWATYPGDLYGYAYNSSVGYINFCGTHTDINALNAKPPIILSIPNAGPNQALVTYHPFIGDNGGRDGGREGRQNQDPAQGKYEIVIPITDPNGTLVGPDKYTYSVTPKWLDTVRSDQVTKCKNQGCAGEEVRFNAVTKPSVFKAVCDRLDKSQGTVFCWEDGRGIVGYVSSVAPTNSMGARPPSPNGLDQLILQDITITASDPNNQNQKVTVPKPPFIAGGPLQFGFDESITVTDINSYQKVVAIRGSSVAVPLSVRKIGGTGLPNDDSQISVATQLHDCSDTFYFLYDKGDVGVVRDPQTGKAVGLSDPNDPDAPLLPEQGEITNIDRTDVVCQNGNVQAPTVADTTRTPLSTVVGNGGTQQLVVYSDAQDPNQFIQQGVTTDGAVGIMTRIEYSATSGQSVRYYSRFLSDGSVSNQTADVRGDIKLDVAVAQSLGAAAASKREPFYRAITKIIGVGANRNVSKESDTGVVTVSGSPKNKDGSPATFKYYNRTNTGVGPNDKTNPCKIILDNQNGAITFQKSLTIVSEGCDFYIDQDIYDQSAKLGRLGIVALEDLTMEGQRRGGTMYICHKVTDIEANIVTDGSVFGYGGTETWCGNNKDDNSLINQANGLPQYWGSPRINAKRQLTLMGSLVSNNTYGGSLSTPPIMGDGTRAKSQDDLATARLFDLDFLRYASTVKNGNQICWAQDVTLSKLLGPSTCDKNFPGSNGSGRGIVNVIYRAPRSDMQVFNAVNGN